MVGFPVDLSEPNGRAEHGSCVAAGSISMPVLRDKASGEASGSSVWAMGSVVLKSAMTPSRTSRRWRLEAGASASVGSVADSYDDASQRERHAVRSPDASSVSYVAREIYRLIVIPDRTAQRASTSGAPSTSTHTPTPSRSAMPSPRPRRLEAGFQRPGPRKRGQPAAAQLVLSAGGPGRHGEGSGLRDQVRSAGCSSPRWSTPAGSRSAPWG